MRWSESRREKANKPIIHVIAWFTEPNSATGRTAGKAKGLEVLLGDKWGATHVPLQ